jgi:Ca2+-binding RTX toxin-like protein
MAITKKGTALDDILIGTSSDDILLGLAGNDKLVGNKGNDRLVGGAGNDTLLGGAGDDTLLGGAGNDVLKGGAGNDVLKGGAGDDVLQGGVGSDRLIGGSGNDTLDGGSGDDQMAGGTGDDLYIVDSVGDVVTEGAGEGTDTVNASINFTLSAHVENLTLTGIALNGTGNVLDNVIKGNDGNNTLSGDAGNDTLEGGVGDDILNGGLGNDQMMGGVGNDTYVVDSLLDAVTEAAGAGIDLVQASIDYTLGANVENLTLTGMAAINGTGNELDNMIQGNGGDNEILGAGGNDTLNGGAGNDTLNGGLGNDVMAGGLGNDIYTIDSGDTLTEAVGEGTDTVNANFSYTLGANFENLTLTGLAIDGTGNSLDNILTGNFLNNTLTGDLGDDTLDGGLGNDTMVGGFGNDTYVVNSVGDVVTEAWLFGGNDTVRSSISYALDLAVENLTLIGTDAITGEGTVAANIMLGNSGNNDLYGYEGDDTLNGDAGNDYLSGGDGNDTVSGDAGDDNLRGGLGNDSLNGGDGSDRLRGCNSSSNPGQGEIDTLTGGVGNDTFVLGNSSSVFYDDGIGGFGAGGESDYALITDFTDGQDVIELKELSGWFTGYSFSDVTVGSVSGVGIYSNGFLTSELIGIVQGVSAAQLTLGVASGGVVTVS